MTAQMLTLDEEDGNIVPYNIPISLFGIHLESKSSHIPHGVRRPSTAKHSGEAQEDGRLA